MKVFFFIWNEKKNDKVPLQEEFRSVLWCKKRVHRLNNKLKRLTFNSSDDSALKINWINKIKYIMKLQKFQFSSLFVLIQWKANLTKERQQREIIKRLNERGASFSLLLSVVFVAVYFFFFYENEILDRCPFPPEQIETDEASWTHSAGSRSNQLWVVDPQQQVNENKKGQGTFDEEPSKMI